ncbi:SPL family radical SAM protein [Thermodesulfobacterium thermophilum]|uniref:SPL family radical SAM protein n=1 Tax=Thermodesulfobacterium thermophilum TaxID=886 RepID=UPI001FDF322E|nr:radical SAM protein [Thermodesulfobacterium thermophilum]
MFIFKIAMPYITPFDPWKSPLCTCPPKYSLNPYTGCGHGCLYCYASIFIKDFYSPRPKKEFLKKIEKELPKLPPESLISLSNSSDPYQPLEKIYKSTRMFLDLIKGLPLKVLIITKSNLVLRDIDLLKKLKVAVAITITTKSYQARLEPGAPPFEERLLVLKVLSQEGIPTIVRIDPIIPEINEEEALEVLTEVLPFVKHVVVSTYKAKPQSLKRLIEAFPEKAKTLTALYLQKGEKKKGGIYLPEEIRRSLVKRIYHRVNQVKGVGFATCREGLVEFSFQGRCDGSFLLN